MPTPDAVLNSLAAIANEWRWLAAAWHAFILAFLILALLRRPPQRPIAMLLVLPIISVSALAWWSGNPFNGSTFMLLAVLMAFAAMRLDNRRIGVGSTSLVAVGLLLFAFGFLYPHFLPARSWMAYVYMSPFGLLPCPTLAVVTGISLIFEAFGSRRWAGTLLVASLAYGIIGMAALGVWIDAMLIVGALTLWRHLLPGRQRVGDVTTPAPPALGSAPD